MYHGRSKKGIRTESKRRYGSFRERISPSTDNTKRLRVNRLMKSTFLVLGIVCLFLAAVIHMNFHKVRDDTGNLESKDTADIADSFTHIATESGLNSDIKEEQKRKEKMTHAISDKLGHRVYTVAAHGTRASRRAKLADIDLSASKETVPGCSGKTFSDHTHAGKDVCTHQECIGVVYMRYVDTTTFACSNDPSLLTEPCDLTKCEGVAPPPPSTPGIGKSGVPPPPASGGGSKSYSPGYNFPPVPTFLKKKAASERTFTPLKKSYFNVSTSEVKALSELNPIGDVGYSRGKRDKKTLENASKLWGPPGPPKAAGWPTHAFWQNLVLGEGTSDQSAITNLPYIIQAATNGLVIDYPYVMSSASQSANMFNLASSGIAISIGSESKSKRSIESYDTLSVQVQWEAKDGSFAKSRLVQGDPYISMEVNSASERALTIASKQTMILSSRGSGQGSPSICDPNLSKADRPTSVTGSIFDIYTASSDQTWRLYTYPSASIACPYPIDTNHTATSIDFLEEFKGVIRLAMIMNCTTGSSKNCFEPSGLPLDPSQRSDPAFPNLIDAYSGVLLTGGEVSYQTENDHAVNIQLKYKSRSLTKDNEGNAPLLLALPHHISAGVLNDQQEYLPGKHRSMIGTQTPFAGQVMNLNIPLPEILWGDERPITGDVKAIEEAMKADADYDIKAQWQMGVGDPYNAGKLNARLARLALIAHQLNQTKVADNFLQKLEKYQSLWLSGSSPNPLIYDKDMGGVVSCGCMFDSCMGKCKPHCTNGGPDSPGGCPNLGAGDFAAGLDFGNGYYNDHHFHWGYHLYASAVLARFRPQWAKSNLEKMLLLVRDVANPSKSDRYFPQFRHADFYAGHSWAGGIFRAFVNGRNQESTSEAVNCW